MRSVKLTWYTVHKKTELVATLPFHTNSIYIPRIVRRGWIDIWDINGIDACRDMLCSGHRGSDPGFAEKVTLMSLLDIHYIFLSLGINLQNKISILWSYFVEGVVNLVRPMGMDCLSDGSSYRFGFVARHLSKMILDACIMWTNMKKLMWLVRYRKYIIFMTSWLNCTVSIIQIHIFSWWSCEIWLIYVVMVVVWICRHCARFTYNLDWAQNNLLYKFTTYKHVHLHVHVANSLYFTLTQTFTSANYLKLSSTNSKRNFRTPSAIEHTRWTLNVDVVKKINTKWRIWILIE